MIIDYTDKQKSINAISDNKKKVQYTSSLPNINDISHEFGYSNNLIMKESVNSISLDSITNRYRRSNTFISEHKKLSIGAVFFNLSTGERIRYSVLWNGELIQREVRYVY